MHKIILSTVAIALIAISASQTFAAQPQHHVRRAPQAMSEQFRNARNSVGQRAQPAWPYSGWSAPAGR
ncbi:hypothetical protein ACNJX9_20305 [Bradyrhizobium sp. DASA03076]|uniref:hypothetical protein n=1 Tax=Bradyrhizobium sp. BLXBL-03 TaxID=3395916 RepID=UPI003F72C752